MSTLAHRFMTRPFRMSEHRSFPKPTPRLQDRVQQRREALRAWQACVRAVDARDQYRCRSCTRRTRQTYTVCPERLEHHHLVGRNVAPHLVADTRNVICVCLECHGKLTRHELYVEGRAEDMFSHEGRRYWNADYPLHFTPAEPAAG